LAKAKKNEAFASGLETSTVTGIEWSITIKFYAALHYVQAYFASKQLGTPITHSHRASAIQRDAVISAVYDDYRELEDLSRDARYNSVNLKRGHVKFAEDCLESIKSAVYKHMI
jgi:hypothetical protein